MRRFVYWLKWNTASDFIRTYRANRDPQRGEVRTRRKALYMAWMWVRHWRYWRAA